MRFKYLMLSLCMIGLVSCQALPTSFDAGRLGTIERDITYCTMDGVALKLDIHYPVTREKQWPVVVYVHGGAWMSGTKDVVTAALDTKALSEAGFLLVSVEYRFAPHYKFPAMIEDVKCAVRYLRAHAAEYNLDPSRLGAAGDSAGGHLVSLLGLADKTAGFDIGEYLNYSSSVQAVVDMYGPTDVAPPYTNRLFFNKMDVFGTFNQDDPIFLEASPINYTSPNSPPFLIIQGQQDTTVPPLQSRLLFEHLQRKGAPVEMLVVKNAGHNLLPVSDAPLNPPMEEIQSRIMEFWKKYLK